MILSTWKKCLNQLVLDEELTELHTHSIPNPERPDDIVPFLIVEGISNLGIGNALNVAYRMPIFTIDLLLDKEDVQAGLVGENIWLLTDGTLYISNPLDRKLKDSIIQIVGECDRYGYLSPEVQSHSEWFALKKTAIDSEIEVLENSAAIKGLIALIIEEAIEKGVSDIHLLPNEILGRVDVKHRIHGQLIPVRTLSNSDHRSLTNVLITSDDFCGTSILLKETQSPAFTYFYKNKRHPFRVERIPSGRSGEYSKIVLRHIDSSVVKSISRLGLPKSSKRIIENFLSRKDGIMFVTGPTGSGKTTTLLSCLVYSRQFYPNRSRASIEDPIESELQGVDQVQVTEKITFAKALRSLLRQDPDVIMVGEVRDEETANLATQASLTGHQILSSIHVNNSHEVFRRLSGLGISKDDIIQTLKIIVSQRLVRSLCKRCKVEDKENAAEDLKNYTEIIDFFYPGAEIKYYMPGAGCANCDNTGYHVRLPIFETLEVNPSIEEAIADGLSMRKFRRESINSGDFEDFWVEGIGKVISGVTTLEELATNLPAYEKRNYRLSEEI